VLFSEKIAKSFSSSILKLKEHEQFYYSEPLKRVVEDTEDTKNTKT